MILAALRFLTARGFSAAGAKVALMIFGAIAGLLLLSLGKCAYDHRATKQAKVNTSQAEAAADAGANALDVARETATKHTETDATVKDGTDAIRSAPDGATAALAARCANCGLRVYRDTRQCAGLLASGECKRFTPSD